MAIKSNFNKYESKFGGLETDDFPVGQPVESKFYKINNGIGTEYICVGAGNGLYGSDLSWVPESLFNNDNESLTLGTGISNARTSIFNDLITGIRRPTLQSNFSQGIPLNYLDYKIQNGANVEIEEVEGGFTGNIKLNSGTFADGVCQLSSLKPLRYMMGHESYLGGTIAFSAPQTNSKMQYGLVNIDTSRNILNGFLFEYDGLDFGVARYNNGTRVQFIKKENFNGDFDIDDLDLTKLNIYQITFAFFGVAPITFWAFDGETTVTSDGKITGVGRWRILHQIKYAGTEATPHISNPNLSIFAKVENSGNTTPIFLKTASFEIGNVDGASESIDASARSQNYVNPAKTINGGATGQLICAFQSPSLVSMIDSFDGTTISYGDFLNTIPSQLTKLTVVSDGASVLKIELWLVKNSSITGGTFDYTSQGDSLLKVSTNATYTLTGGRRLDVFLINKTDYERFDVKSDVMLLYPRYTAIFVGFATNNVVNLQNKWLELF